MGIEKNNNYSFITVIFLIIFWFSILNMFVIGEVSHLFLLNNYQNSNYIASNELFVKSLHSWYFKFFIFLTGLLIFINTLISVFRNKLSVLKSNIFFTVQFFIVVAFTAITIILAYSKNLHWNLKNVFFSYILFIVLTNIVVFIKKYFRKKQGRWMQSTHRIV